MPFVCTPNEARWNFLIGCRCHTVDGVLSCRPMFFAVYCSVNPVYVILRSIGSNAAEVDPSNSLLMPQFQPKIPPPVERSPLIRWRRDVSWLPNAERHAFGSETERCWRGALSYNIHRTNIHLNEDYCICGNAIISIHQTKHGSSEMGAWLEKGRQTGTEEDYLQCIIILSSTYWNMRSNIINSFWNICYYICIYIYHIITNESSIYRKPEKTSWHLSESPQISRPQVLNLWNFIKAKDLQGLARWTWCLLMFNNEKVVQQNIWSNN